MSKTPRSDQLEETRRELRQERTPAYGDALRLCRDLESKGSPEAMWDRFIAHLNVVQPLTPRARKGQVVDPVTHKNFIGSAALYKKLFLEANAVPTDEEEAQAESRVSTALQRYVESTDLKVESSKLRDVVMTHRFVLAQMGYSGYEPCAVIRIEKRPNGRSLIAFEDPYYEPDNWKLEERYILRWVASESLEKL